MKGIPLQRKSNREWHWRHVARQLAAQSGACRSLGSSAPRGRFGGKVGTCHVGGAPTEGGEWGRGKGPVGKKKTKKIKWRSGQGAEGDPLPHLPTTRLKPPIHCTERVGNGVRGWGREGSWSDSVAGGLSDNKLAGRRHSHSTWSYAFLSPIIFRVPSTHIHPLSELRPLARENTPTPRRAG